MRFWKHKSEKPLVRNYYGWYYSVEYYGITLSFIDIKQLREFRNDIAEGKRKSTGFSRPIWTEWGFAVRMFHLKQRFIHFCYRKKIVKFLDEAYEQFSSEIDNEENVIETIV